MDLLLAFSSLGHSEVIGSALFQLISTDSAVIMNDPVLHDAFQVAARRHGGSFIKSALGRIRPRETNGLRDVLYNGDIEKIQGDQPDGWKPRFHGGFQNAVFSAVKEGRNGSMCLKVTSNQSSDSGWAATIKVKLGG